MRAFSPMKTCASPARARHAGGCGKKAGRGKFRLKPEAQNRRKRSVWGITPSVSNGTTGMTRAYTLLSFCGKTARAKTASNRPPDRRVKPLSPTILPTVAPSYQFSVERIQPLFPTFSQTVAPSAILRELVRQPLLPTFLPTVAQILRGIVVSAQPLLPTVLPTVMPDIAGARPIS